MTSKEYFMINLMEELAELIQASAKVLRFSDNHQFEDYERTNIQHFQKELLDVLALLHIVALKYELKLDFSTESMMPHVENKLEMYKTALRLGTVVIEKNDTPD
jgi:NTP pyrophosphatase (non-canonical NTP hydrolase)